MNKYNGDRTYSWKRILIEATGVLVAGSGLIWLAWYMSNPFIFTIGHTAILAGGLWIIIRTYVIALWRKYPWETHPLPHTILEVIGIGIIAALYNLGFYRIELGLNLIDPAEDLGLQVLVTILITYLVTAIHEMIFFYRQWIRNFSKSVKLEKDNIQAKYETLKTQINPHFLFNSLNSLTHIVDENPAAVSYIHNLSEFLRYMLRSRDRDLVYLRDELKVLNHYFELQKSRFTDNLEVHLDIPEKYHLYTLPPLVLQMLVENCIKHNVISSEKPLNISVTAGKESITVKNNLQKKTGVESTAQGLKNISERYRYFTPKEVQIRETHKEFSVTVPILVVEL